MDFDSYCTSPMVKNAASCWSKRTFSSLPDHTASLLKGTTELQAGPCELRPLGLPPTLPTHPPAQLRSLQRMAGLPLGAAMPSLCRMQMGSLSDPPAQDLGPSNSLWSRNELVPFEAITCWHLPVIIAMPTHQANLTSVICFEKWSHKKVTRKPFPPLPNPSHRPVWAMVVCASLHILSTLT